MHSGRFVSTDLSFSEFSNKFLRDLDQTDSTPDLTRLKFIFRFSCSDQSCGNVGGEERDRWEGIHIQTRYATLSTGEALRRSHHCLDSASKSSCIVCGKRNDRRRDVISTPLILLVRFGLLLITQVPKLIQEFIVFEGTSYALQAVIYGNGSHFITRYKAASRDGAIYEYDGLQTSRERGYEGVRHALCTRLEGDASSLFLGRVAQAYNRKHYNVNDCFYYKVTN